MEGCFVPSAWLARVMKLDKDGNVWQSDFAGTREEFLLKMLTVVTENPNKTLVFHVKGLEGSFLMQYAPEEEPEILVDTDEGKV